jgi:putative heme-binding domain-containing protein
MVSAGVLGLTIDATAPALALQQEATVPHWIWHPPAPGSGTQSFPAETCYFRKTFFVKEVSRLVLDVTADHAFSLYLDGKPVADGNEWRQPRRVETKIEIGRHVLAVRASNEAAGPAGLLLRGGVLPLGQGIPIQTNSTWKSARRVPDGDGWKNFDFDDDDWSRAYDLGVVGGAPWGHVAFGEDPSSRFTVPEGFSIQTVAHASVTGSLVAFTFDFAGQPCVSIERGPIARLIDDDKDGLYDRCQPITPQMKNCQGLSFIRGRLYAVGQGPGGTGLYRLEDVDNDGIMEKAELIRLSQGGMGEHGPHAVALGPDGRLYYNNGNHAHLKPPIDPASPVNVAYEGELLPHYNDSRGHAAGIMAPGGEIYRSDDDGKSWKRVAAGFRNEYDFAFNRDGELFSFDSDMEWDIGLPWYRPVRVVHCPLGVEFGWRNGSAKWPAYYFDSLPAILDVGRGSPTGVTFYQAHQFPVDYHDRMLVCDWSQGRILAVKLERQGAGYAASALELVTGQPLNCTDIEIGPEGSVYFTTGGRDTQGGLYRVSWNKPRPGTRQSEPTWTQAIMLDTPLASFSQRRAEDLRRQDRQGWDRALPAEARDQERSRSSEHRVRALDLLCQVGPEPSESLLLELASDHDQQVRARTVGLLGERATEAARGALVKALRDSDPFVRRHACEGLMQQPASTIPVDRLIPLLSDLDRWIRFAARTAIEHADLGPCRSRLLELQDPRARVEGMLALVRATRLDGAGQNDLLKREIELLANQSDPALELDLLRLIELTILLGPAKAEAAPLLDLRPLLSHRFSRSTDTPANREIARLLAFVDEPAAVDAILGHQSSIPDHESQIHDAYCLRALKHGWNWEHKQKFWSWFEAASRWQGGYSFAGYLDYMVQGLVELLTQSERDQILSRGESFPFPTRVLVRKLKIDRELQIVATLVSLYRRLIAVPGAGVHGEDLRSLIVEKLGRSSSSTAHEALRELAVLQPARQNQFARALADHPSESDLPYLISALEAHDQNTANMVTAALRKLKSSPKGPEGLAGLIRIARRSGPSSRDILDELASRWTGAPVTPASNSFDQALSAWEDIYRERYPSAAALIKSEASRAHAYGLPELRDNVLQGTVMKTASAARGAQVIVKARCLDCHKFAENGTGVGPDLTTVNSRFQPAEIIESIVLPSKVISDQYKSVSLATEDGKLYGGMPVLSDGPNLVLLLSDGTKVTIPKDQIEEQKPSTISVMPEGLLNPLSYQEIADLLALFNSMPRVAAPENGAAKGK